VFGRFFALSVFLLTPALSIASPVDITSVPVTLSIQQSCLVHSSANDETAALPAVDCLHGEPYAISQVDRDPTHVPSPVLHEGGAASNGIWMVAF
jgi:hypothetical protein